MSLKVLADAALAAVWTALARLGSGPSMAEIPVPIRVDRRPPPRRPF